MELYTALSIAAFFISVAYVFVRISEYHGITRGFIAAMLCADLYAIMLMLLGIDRPMLIITIRGNPVITITYMQVFLIMKIPFTIWTVMNRERITKILG